MKNVIISVISLAFLAGCNSVSPTYHEGNNSSNYKAIFKNTTPSDVTVVNSIITTYPRRLSLMKTSHWEIELLATREWIEHTTIKMNLRSTQIGGSGYDAIKRRKQGVVESWYAPKTMDQYECYCLYTTSIPYIHMLVEKKSEDNGRYRVFLSKY